MSLSGWSWPVCTLSHVENGLRMIKYPEISKIKRIISKTITHAVPWSLVDYDQRICNLDGVASFLGSRYLLYNSKHTQCIQMTKKH